MIKEYLGKEVKDKKFLLKFPGGFVKTVNFTPMDLVKILAFAFVFYGGILLINKFLS